MKKYFSFTRGQQTGIFIWSVIIVGLIISSGFLANQKPEAVFEVNPKDIQYVQYHTEMSRTDEQPANQTTYNPVHFEDFDPNTLDLSGWKNLGFSDKQANVIVNYRDQFGPFKRKEDLKKIFVISDEKYHELEPFIKIESAPNHSGTSTLISLNEATITDLEALPGIGAKFAERIINFRNALGGFVSMTQLHEVYNMTEDIYQILASHTELTDAPVNQIKINSASKDQIDKHPYIDFDVTAAILKERELRKIENLDFLLTKNLVTVEEKERIEPYISFE